MTIRDKNVHKSAAISLSKIQGLGARGPLSGNPRYVIKGAATAMSTWIRARVKSEYIHTTIDAAITAAGVDNGANRGDTIYVLPNHTENLAADSAVDIDVAGLNIIGLGNGEDRPILTFTTLTTADFKIAAANVLIENLVFKCNIASQAMMIEVTGDDAEISNCEFREGTATGLNFITIGVTSDNEADRCHIHDCKFYTSTDGNYNSAINFAKDEVGVTVDNNNIYGYFALAGMDIPSVGDAQVHCEMHDNEIVNLSSGQHAIQVSGTTSTGKIVRNLAITDSKVTAIDAGGLEMSRNRWNDFTDQGPDEAFPAEDVEKTHANSRGGYNWHVNSAATVGGDGKTWETAVTTIQAAVTLCGDNDTVKILGTSAVAQTSDYSEDVVIAAGVNGVHIKGCGNSPEGVLWTVASASGTCLTINGLNALVENIRFRPNGATGRAIFLAKNTLLTSNAAGTIIRKCTFRSTSSDSVGIQSEGANDITVEDCVFKECTYAFYLVSSANAVMYRLRFRHNYIDQNCTNGIVVDCTDSFIHDNHFGDGLTAVINTWNTGDPTAKRNAIYNNNLTTYQMMSLCTITSTDDYSGEQEVIALPKGQSGTFWVDSDRTTSGLGTSPNTAVKTVAEAITAIGSTTHCTVYIKKGIYTEAAVIDLAVEGTILRGQNKTGDMWGTTSIKATASHTIMSVNANECEIHDLSFIQNTANPIITVANTATCYKTIIRDCHFNGNGTHTYGVNVGGTGIGGDGIDTHVEGCTFVGCVTVGFYMYGTRCVARNNLFIIASSAIAIEYPQGGGARPVGRIIGNTIRGFTLGDTGIKLPGAAISTSHLDISGNHVTNCATPITLAKYTTWYDGNYWGVDDDKYHSMSDSDKHPGRVFFCDSDVTTGGDGRSWASAFKTFTAAIAVATTRNDTIYMAAANACYEEANTVDITTIGLQVIGMGNKDPNHAKAMFLAPTNTGHLMTINAHEVWIDNICFNGPDDTKDAVRICTTEEFFKIKFTNCKFDSTDGEYGIKADDTYDAPDLVIENCHFRYWVTCALYLNTTRAKVLNCQFMTLASATGIELAQDTDGRPDLVLENNTIIGVDSSDTGIKITNTPNEGTFTMVGNRVINCETPVTLSKFTSWYDNNYWGTEDWRYHAGHGKEAAMARGADGNIFYADGNIATTGLDGRCWASAYKTLTEVLAIAHADVAANRNWARRNTIYCIADTFTEDLTKLSQKTDIVGLGSYNHNQKPGLTGTHIIEDADYYGCRWYNFWFRENATNPIFVLTPKCGGIEFHECEFDGTAGLATHAINITTRCPSLIVDNCDLIGKTGGGFTTAAIAFGVGQSNTVQIKNNRISAAGVGILTVSTSEFGFDSFVLDNVINTVGKCINDPSGIMPLHIIGNRCIVDTNNGSGTAYTWTNKLALDNVITSADNETHRVPDLDSDA